MTPVFIAGGSIKAMEDAALMSEVRKGSLETLAVLFERHSAPLFGFFLRLTGHRGHSEDLVQEVFLRILKYRQSFRPDSPFVPWMYQIARNTHLSQLQKIREMDPEAILDQVPDPGESAHARLEREHGEALMQRALDRLSLRKRELLLLSRQPELSYQQLAEMLGCSVASVKVQVHRALKELRQAYLEVQGGER